MKKSLFRLLPTALLIIAALSLSACDNENYTEYGGSITSLDPAGMSAAEARYEESSIVSSIEKAEKETTSLYEGAVIVPELTPAVRTAADREGGTAVIPENVETIISAAPAITEILVGLGAGDKIIAADTYSANVVGIDPAICTLDFFNLDIEQLIMLDPDLIIISGMSVWGDEDPYTLLRDMGATVIYIPTSNSIEGIKLDIEFIGQMTGEEARAALLISDINTKVLEVRERVSELTKPTVYFEVEGLPALYSCGSDTLINELIEIAGGRNIYADENGWIQNSEESVIAASPDFILSSVFYTGGMDISEVSNRPGWNIIPAVINGNVYAIDLNAVSRPSQYIVDALEEIADILHP
ncbi:MAG: ABC transporter substrate-binding protein [Ruminococcus sp.]|jgi:iron complex transport system substrate-binding protein|nr:ABC transporter substrate-binding protein [Ruminococcus sp.]